LYILLHVLFKQDVVFLLLRANEKNTLRPPFSISNGKCIIFFIDENATKQKRIFCKRNKRKQTTWTEIYYISML